MLQRVAWTALLAGVPLIAGIALGVVAYANKDQSLALLALTVTLSSITPSVLSYREA